MNYIKRQRSVHLVFSVISIVLCCIASSEAKSRWSSTQIIPDADFLYGGQFVLGVPVYYFQDTAGKSVVRPSGYLNFGPTEWVNVQAGYAGGYTMGFKARILGEKGPLIPSIALGAHNLFSHSEQYLFSTATGQEMNTELYLAFSRGFESIKTRLHLGVQSIVSQPKERVNPYFGLEKYFGSGLYVSFEVHRRAELFHPSLFISWRFIKKRVELCVGAVSLAELFMGQGSGFEFGLDKPENGHLIRPGIWVGLRYQGNIGNGENDGLSGVEDRLTAQQVIINKLSADISELKKAADANRASMTNVDKSLKQLADTTKSQEDFLQSLLYSKVVALRALYTAQPFEPEKVRNALDEIAAFKEKAVAPLGSIAANEKEDGAIRILCVTILGEIGDRAASGTVLGLLTPTAVPAMKVEALIALGKMRETRGAYLMEQLVNDPDDAVAYTAREVLRRLQRETGIKTSVGSDTLTALRPVQAKPAPDPVKTVPPKPVVDTVKPASTSNSKASPLSDTLAAPAKSADSIKAVPENGTSDSSAAAVKKPASVKPKSTAAKNGSAKNKKPASKSKPAPEPDDTKSW